MKQLSFVWMLLFAFCGRAQSDDTLTDDRQIAYARSWFADLSDFQLLHVETRYVSLEEMLAQMYRIVGEGNGPQKDIIADMKKNYDQEKRIYVKNYYQAFTPAFLAAAKCDSIDWKTAVIDTIAYEYKIIDTGRDQRVRWPESQTYQLPADRFVMSETAIYFHDDHHRYLVSFEAFLCNGKWGLFRSANIPRIVRKDP